MNQTQGLKQQNLDIVLRGLERHDISTIGTVVSEVMRLIDNPRTHVADIVKIYKMDLAASSRLINICNTAYSSRVQKIDTLQEAIIRVGFHTARNVILSSTICDIFKDDTPIGTYSRSALWQHSRVVAAANDLIYRRVLKKRNDSAFIAGLLHDIGMVIADQFLHQGFCDAVTAYSRDEESFLQAEKEYLGITHQQIGYEVAKSWQFTDPLAYIIGHHHSKRYPADKYTRTLLQVTQVSEIMALTMGYGGLYDGMLYDAKIESDLCEELEIPRTTFCSIIPSLSEEIVKLEEHGWFYDG